ncbi:MAG TPA: 3-methyl-2-oxobutanoate hydroxymethyltransferase, partial [Kribbella sp.]
KPPYLPAAPPPPAQQAQQRYGEQQHGRQYGEQPQRSDYYGESRSEPRPETRESRGEPRPETRESRGEPRAEMRDESSFGPSNGHSAAAYPEQNPFRPQTPPAPQGRPGPFAPGNNGVPPNRQPQASPQQQVPRPPAAPQATNGVSQRPTAPHSSNGNANWSSPAPQPSPAPAPSQPPTLPSVPSTAPTAAPTTVQSNGLSQQPPRQPQQPGPSQTGQTGQPRRAGQPGRSRPSAEARQSELKQDNGYLSDPSAEYESNAPVSEDPKPVGARRRADVQQDAPSQVPAEQVTSHRGARRAQLSASTAPGLAGPPASPGLAAASAPGLERPSSGLERQRSSGLERPASSGLEEPSGPELEGPSAPGDEQSSAAGENRPAGGGGSVDASKRPRRYRVHHLRDMKNRGEKWAMLTAYDQYTAEIFDQAGIPVLLVGDSAANNVFGYDTTLRVTVDELIPLARAVAGAVDRALVVADLPFGSYQASPEQAFHTAVRFMKEAGVHAVKLEGGRTVVPMVEKLTQSGIPVMAHIGFTPQSEHSIGGYRVQGRGDQAAGLIDDAVALAEAGAFSVVLEMVPGDVAAEITKRVTIPTIGIGAGRDTDAQVLVWQDMAGLRSGTMPRFVKQYADLRGILTSAVTTYAADVASGAFPGDEHTF